MHTEKGSKENLNTEQTVKRKLPKFGRIGQRGEH